MLKEDWIYDMLFPGTVKEYLKAINHVFSVEDIAALIMNSIYTWEEKICYLELLRDKIEDSGLLNDYFLSIVKIEEVLKLVKDQNYILVGRTDFENFIENQINLIDISRDLDQIFNTYRNEYAVDSKLVLTDGNATFWVDVLGTNRDDVQITMCFNNQCQLLSVLNENSIQKLPWFNHYISYPNDFKKGDIVRFKDSVYIVSQESRISSQPIMEFRDQAVIVSPLSTFGTNTRRPLKNQEYIRTDYLLRIGHMNHEKFVANSDENRLSKDVGLFYHRAIAQLIATLITIDSGKIDLKYVFDYDFLFHWSVWHMEQPFELEGYLGFVANILMKYKGLDITEDIDERIYLRSSLIEVRTTLIAELIQVYSIYTKQIKISYLTIDEYCNVCIGFIELVGNVKTMKRLLDLSYKNGQKREYLEWESLMNAIEFSNGSWTKVKSPGNER